MVARQNEELRMEKERKERERQEAEARRLEEERKERERQEAEARRLEEERKERERQEAEARRLEEERKERERQEAEARRLEEERKERERQEAEARRLEEERKELQNKFIQWKAGHSFLEEKRKHEAESIGVNNISIDKSSTINKREAYDTSPISHNEKSTDFVEKELLSRYKQQGYLLEDEIVDYCIDQGLELPEIDRLCDRLLTQKVIIRDSSPDVSQTRAFVEDAEDYSDHGHIDYTFELNRIKQEYPNCRHLIDSILSIMPPQHREWKTLIGEAKDGNEYAWNRLILMYLRTAFKRAYDYASTYHCDFEDCFQNAILGLITAIDKYDLSSTTNYSSYIALWMRQSMDRNYMAVGMPFELPAHYFNNLVAVLKDISTDDYNNLERVERDIVNRHEESCDFTGIYRELERSFWHGDEKYFQSLSGNRVDYRFLVPPYEIYDDLLYDEDNFDALLLELSSVDFMKRVQELLSAKEFRVLEKRYGFSDNTPRTLEEVGSMMGVTRERVRQIEKKALKKLSLDKRIRTMRDIL